MSNIEDRLRTDAAEISAEVPADLSARIRRALNQETASTRRSRSGFPFGTPLVVGFAMGLIIVVTGVLWFSQLWLPPAGVQVAATPRTVAGYQGTVLRFATVLDRRMSDERELERELEHLNADVRKIQQELRSQLQPLL